MTPNEREFGEVLGELRGLREQITGMEQRNTTEHAAVIRRLDGLEVKLDSKVDWVWMREQELPTRMDSLEQTRDEGRGMARLVNVAKGALGLALAVAAFLFGKGGGL